MLKKAVSKAAAMKIRGVPLGYVEGLNDARRSWEQARLGAPGSGG